MRMRIRPSFKTEGRLVELQTKKVKQLLELYQFGKGKKENQLRLILFNIEIKKM